MTMVDDLVLRLLKSCGLTILLSLGN